MRWVVALTVLAVTALTGLNVINDLVQNRTPMILAIPLQSNLRSAEIDHTEALRQQAGLLSEIPALTIVENPVSSRMDVIDHIRQLARTSPDLLANSDLGASVASILNMYFQSTTMTGNNDIFAALCLDLRWTPIRLNRFAKSCSKAIRCARRESIPYQLRLLQNGLLILNPDKRTRNAVQSYLRFPYSAEPIYSLALLLMVRGYKQAAWNLHGELIQIDIEIATKLETELARMGGLEYNSHRLPW